MAPKRSRMIRAQIRRSARNFAISSKKSIPHEEKNDARGANWSTLSPRSHSSSKMLIAWLSANAAS